MKRNKRVTIVDYKMAEALGDETMAKLRRKINNEAMPGVSRAKMVDGELVATITPEIVEMINLFAEQN